MPRQGNLMGTGAASRESDAKSRESIAWSRELDSMSGESDAQVYLAASSIQDSTSRPPRVVDRELYTAPWAQ